MRRASLNYIRNGILLKLEKHWRIIRIFLFKEFKLLSAELLGNWLDCQTNISLLIFSFDLFDYLVSYSHIFPTFIWISFLGCSELFSLHINICIRSETPYSVEVSVKIWPDEINIRMWRVKPERASQNIEMKNKFSNRSHSTSNQVHVHHSKH